MKKEIDKKEAKDEDKLSAIPNSANQLSTDKPLSEKDEEKQVEDEMRIKMGKDIANKTQS